MIKDLLTFGADRERYYYASDGLFKRHFNIMQMLLNNAPALTPELLDGLIWRTRIAVNGHRRPNYFIKHLIIDLEGKFAKTLDWVGKIKDPKNSLPSKLDPGDGHCVESLCLQYIYRGYSFFIFTLVEFTLSQSISQKVETDDMKSNQIRYAGLRMFNYIFSMMSIFCLHAKKVSKAVGKREFIRIFGRIPIPKYLENWQEVANLSLGICLLVMLIFEPQIRCMSAGNNNADDCFLDRCEASVPIYLFPYTVFAMLGMFLYYELMIDPAVFNN